MNPSHQRPPSPPGLPRAQDRLRRWGAALLLASALTVAAHGPVHEQILQLTSELETHPEDPVRLNRRGELLLLHGVPAEARADFERASRIRPDDVTNDFRLGQASLDLGVTNEAVLRLERFVRVRPGSLPGHRALAKAFLLAGEPRRAADEFGAAIALSENPMPDGYLEQARALQAAEAPVDEILQPLDAGIARLGPLPSLQLFAVDLEVRRGQTDRALARLDALAARAERKERWIARRGEILLQAGRTNEARAAFTSAVQALEALPEKLRRAWTATELRQQLDRRLAGLPARADPPPPSP